MRNLISMKQAIPYVIMAGLAVGLVILFMNNGKASKRIEELNAKIDEMEQEESPIQVSGDSRVYYVYLDSINAEYKLTQDMMKKLEAKNNMYQRELESKVRKLQEEAMQAEKDAQYQNDLWKAQKMGELQKKQEDLARREQEMLKNFEIEKDRLNSEMYDEVDKFLEEYRKEMSLDFIIARSALLYANDSLNITRQVINGLNQRYEERQAKTEK